MASLPVFENPVLRFALLRRTENQRPLLALLGVEQLHRLLRRHLPQGGECLGDFVRIGLAGLAGLFFVPELSRPYLPNVWVVSFSFSEQ